MEKIGNSKPSVFEYSSYRNFLGDLYVHLKSNTSYFSYRYFSQKAGYKSPNYFKLVIEGKRNLSDSSIKKFIKALKLSPKEADFFSSLVEFNQSESNAEKAKAALSLMQSKIYCQKYPLEPHHLKYFCNWFYVAIRELILCPHFKSDLEWIGNQFNPALSKAQVSEAIQTLEALKMVKKEGGGKWSVTDANVITPSEVSSHFVRLYHHQMIEKSRQALDQISHKYREISSVCIPIDRETFGKIKSKIVTFRQELMALANSSENADSIYQMNFQFFPLTRCQWEESK